MFANSIETLYYLLWIFYLIGFSFLASQHRTLLQEMGLAPFSSFNRSAQIQSPFPPGIIPPKWVSTVIPDFSWLNSTRQHKHTVYYPNWVAEDNGFRPEHIPLNLVNSVNYAFFTYDKSKKCLKSTSESIDLKEGFFFNGEEVHGALNQLSALKSTNPHLSTCLSIGGWDDTAQLRNLMNEGPVAWITFQRSVVSFMKEQRFNCIDLDWEFPRSMKESESLVHLARGLRYELNRLEDSNGAARSNYHLTIAAPCNEVDYKYMDIAELDNYVSFWNLMCYDFSGPWSPTVSYHSNLYSVNGSTQSADKGVTHYIENGVHPRKLILGMPLYSQTFATQYEEPYGQPNLSGNHPESISNPKSIKRYDVKSLPLGEKRAGRMTRSKENFDPEAVAAWSYLPSLHLWATYDNYQSAREKARYVHDRGLGGGMFWEISQDFPADDERSVVRSFIETLELLSNGSYQPER